MQIYPAIDLQNGQCVRLYQGKFDQATIYSDDPFATANNFHSQGARWLHVVDLDAAKNPKKNQVALIKELVRKTNLQIQTGGGIRETEQIKNLLDSGVERVIVGSYAVKKPQKVQQWLKKFSKERLVLAMDIEFKNNQPYVLISGWQEQTQKKLLELLNFYSINLQHIICTDVARDGTLVGANHELYALLMKAFPQIEFQASGGIQSLLDIRALREKSLGGVIVGRALYEKKFTLSEALLC